jgi:hypothetical protein
MSLLPELAECQSMHPGCSLDVTMSLPGRGLQLQTGQVEAGVQNASFLGAARHDCSLAVSSSVSLPEAFRLGMSGDLMHAPCLSLTDRKARISYRS